MKWSRLPAVGMLAVVLVFGSLGSTGFAEQIIDWTPCQQSELAGTWDIYVGTSGAECMGEYVVQCIQVEVDYDGAILDTGAVMESACGDRMVTGGQLFLSPGCEIEGYINTPQGSVDVERGGHHAYGTLIVDSDIE